MSFILTAIGLLLLLLSLAAMGFGMFMAMEPKNRDSGRFFAVWWVPGAAAASGVLMRDVVTFTVGLLCFLVGGAAFAIQSETNRKPTVKRTRGGRDTSRKAKDENRAAFLGSGDTRARSSILGTESGPDDARVEDGGPVGEEGN